MALLTRRQVRLLLPLGTALALSLTGDSTLYAVLPNQTATVGTSLAAVGAMLGANRLIRIPGNLPHYIPCRSSLPDQPALQHDSCL